MSADPTLIDPLAGLREKIEVVLATAGVSSQDVDTVMAVVRPALDAAEINRQVDQSIIEGQRLENDALRAAFRRAHAVPAKDVSIELGRKEYTLRTVNLLYNKGRAAVLDALKVENWLANDSGGSTP